MEKIFAENRIRYAQRGDYACLVRDTGSTDPRGSEAEPRLLDLTKHTTEKQIKHHTCVPCNAQSHDDMTSLCKDSII